MEYRALGTLELRDGERSIPLAGAKQRALLTLLLVNANHVVSRDRLIDELWGAQPPETVVQSLHVYVSRLRKLLPPDTSACRRAQGGAMNVPAQLPERTVRRRRPITAKGRREFLAALAAGWSVQAAADRAGWQRSRFYALRDADEAFGAEWDEAVEAGCDVLEDALRIAASE